MEGGLKPPFRTSRYLPSGESAAAMGKRVERDLLAGGLDAPAAVEQEAAVREGPDLFARSGLRG